MYKLWYNKTVKMMFEPKGRKRGIIMAVSNEVAWNYALGMIKVDGLEPSKELLELVEKEKRGEVTTEEMRRILRKKYNMKEE